MIIFNRIQTRLYSKYKHLNNECKTLWTSFPYYITSISQTHINIFKMQSLLNLIISLFSKLIL